MSIFIKQATAEDASAISKIYASSWKTAYKGIVPQAYLDNLKDNFWVQSFEKWLTSQTLQADILYSEGIPAGCIGYGPSRDQNLSGWCEIVSLYIAPNFYRHGYGRKLLVSALDTMRSAGYKDCYLWVLSENQNAQRFYESHHFIKTADTYEMELMGKQLIDLRYICRL